MKAKFIKDRETKNTWRYQEMADPPMVGTLYIKKYALKQNFTQVPEYVEVTIEEVEK